LRTRGLPNAWVKRLMMVLAGRAVSAPVLKTSAPPGVEVVLNRQAGRYVVHLINTHAGAPDRLSFPENALILSGLQVQVNLARLGIQGIQSVYTPPNRALSYQQADGWLTVAVPPLVIHTMIVLE
jgi:hypothetical protein